MVEDLFVLIAKTGYKHLKINVAFNAGVVDIAHYDNLPTFRFNTCTLLKEVPLHLYEPQIC